MTPAPSLPGTLEARDAVPPLYVDHLVRYLQEGGVSPPDTLPDLVSARVGRLPHEARILLQCAAILGASSNRVDLAKVAGGEVDLDAGLGILKDRAILLEEGAEIRFGHPLIADLVAAGIPSSARKELHARAADAFAGRGAPLEVRAHHAQRTDGGFSALLLLERAGNAAARRGDREAAVDYFRRGLELARQEISRGEITEPEKPMLMFSAKLGRALLAAGQSLRAEAVVSEALGMGLGGAAERAELLTVLADIAIDRGRMRAAVAHAKEAVDAGARMPRPGSRASLQIALGRTLLRAGDPAGAGLALGEALQTLGEAAHSSTDDRGLRAEALLLLSESQSARGAVQSAAASAAEALRLAEAAGLRGVAGRCLLRLGASASASGDAASAARSYLQAAELFEALGDGLAAHEARREASRSATP
jgi:tetratricopeptide (TPR) repeat protein